MITQIVSKCISNISNKFPVYRKNSYSQCGEDLIIEFLLKHQLHLSKIKYLDIGAHHPKYLSNTYKFYAEGFGTGVLIEPDYELYVEINNKRKSDVVINAGIGFKSCEEIADFYVMTTRTLNTFSKDQAISATNSPTQFGYQEVECVRKVKLYPINVILEQYFASGDLTLLSIDVEGLDYDIIKEIDYKKYAPTCILVETREIVNNVSYDRTDVFEKFLRNHDYELYAKTGINSIFVKTGLLD